MADTGIRRARADELRGCARTARNGAEVLADEARQELERVAQSGKEVRM